MQSSEMEPPPFPVFVRPSLWRGIHPSSSNIISQSVSQHSTSSLVFISTHRNSQQINEQRLLQSPTDLWLPTQCPRRHFCVAPPLYRSCTMPAGVGSLVTSHPDCHIRSAFSPPPAFFVFPSIINPAAVVLFDFSSMLCAVALGS